MRSVLTQHEREALMRAGPRLCGVWGLSEDIIARLLGVTKMTN